MSWGMLLWGTIEPTHKVANFLKSLQNIKCEFFPSTPPEKLNVLIINFYVFQWGDHCSKKWQFLFESSSRSSILLEIAVNW